MLNYIRFRNNVWIHQTPEGKQVKMAFDVSHYL